MITDLYGFQDQTAQNVKYDLGTLPSKAGGMGQDQTAQNVKSDLGSLTSKAGGVDQDQIVKYDLGSLTSKAGGVDQDQTAQNVKSDHGSLPSTCFVKLIFLHGLGDTGAGWSEAFRGLKLKNIKCVCPTAPMMPVSLNGGLKMNSWFDIMALGPDGPQDEDGIKASAAILNDLITNEEKNGIKPENVIVGGFSQGGAVALYTAFTATQKLAGVVALSTWLPLHKQFPKDLKENRDIPVFHGHGMEDPLVPLVWGEATGQLIKQMSQNHDLKRYSMGHSSCPEEMYDVKRFLESLVTE